MGLDSCLQAVFGSSDLDDIFAYSTLRVARVRDRRLGILHYTLQLLIFAYIVGYNLVYERAFLEFDEPIGSARLQLLQPSAEYRVAAPDELAYCGADAPSGLYPCMFADEGYALGYMHGANFLATTRITLSEQTVEPAAACALLEEPGCAFAGVDVTYYVAQLENFTLLIDHAMDVPAFGLSVTGSSLNGKLIGQDGETIDPCAGYLQADPPQVCPPVVSLGVPGQRDIVPLQALLDAAGVPNLDEPLGTTGNSMRYAGMVMQVTIFYSTELMYMYIVCTPLAACSLTTIPAFQAIRRNSQTPATTTTPCG